MSSLESILADVGEDDTYVKFLIAERNYIRSALNARGVCFDEEYLAAAYPSSIGSSIHCDLIEVETWLASLSKKELQTIEDWANDTPERPIFWPSRLNKVSRIMRRLKR